VPRRGRPLPRRGRDRRGGALLRPRTRPGTHRGTRPEAGRQFPVDGHQTRPQRGVANMRTLKITLAALLACSAVALAQPPAKPDAPKKAAPKTDLEKALEEALASNPDIRIAEAKLALAQAELAKARNEVVQKVVTATANLRTSKAMLEE